MTGSGSTGGSGAAGSIGSSGAAGSIGGSGAAGSTGGSGAIFGGTDGGCEGKNTKETCRNVISY